MRYENLRETYACVPNPVELMKKSVLPAEVIALCVALPPGEMIADAVAILGRGAAYPLVRLVGNCVENHATDGLMGVIWTS